MHKYSYHKLRNKFSNNTKVVENYFFMTALQLVNSLFGILIYPYLIRVLGAGSYGLYVFSLSVSSYFSGFVSFGFSYPALKAIVEHKDNPEMKSRIVSGVFTAKILLTVVSAAVYVVLLLTLPLMKQHPAIFAICFVQILNEILFPSWYFQGVQKMRIVTYIQLGLRVLSLPFIFLMIKSAADNTLYALISTLSMVFGGFLSTTYLIVNEGIKIKLTSFSKLKQLFIDSIPFFWSNSTGTIKQESVTIIIGAFFGMKDVALYDLANKIIILPRMLTISINSALFPKVIENVRKEMIRKIICYETFIGLAIIAAVALMGYWVIWILGGINMLQAYPLAVILSATVLVWLVVGCYISFIFVPQNKYYFVTRNQFVAFVSFFLFCIPGVLIFHSIVAVVVALTLSGLSEIAYCNFLINKYKLL